MINTFILLVEIAIILSIYYLINSFILKNELKKYTNEYRIYFKKRHINKHPILYIFFTMFIFLYNKYHKDEIEYDFLKYKVERCDLIKNDPYFITLNNNISVYKNNSVYKIDNFNIKEEEIRKKLRSCALKIKLKKINKIVNDDSK